MVPVELPLTLLHHQNLEGPIPEEPEAKLSEQASISARALCQPRISPQAIRGHHKLGATFCQLASTSIFEYVHDALLLLQFWKGARRQASDQTTRKVKKPGVS